MVSKPDIMSSNSNSTIHLISIKYFTWWVSPTERKFDPTHKKEC